MRVSVLPGYPPAYGVVGRGSPRHTGYAYFFWISWLRFSGTVS